MPQGSPVTAAIGIADMTPNARAMILAEQLSELHAGRWPFLLEAAIRDAENEIVARISKRLEEEPEPMSGAGAAAIARQMMHV